MRNLIKPNSSLDEPLEKRELKRVISEREKLLINLLEIIEHLRITLSILKQEFDIKIGRLYLRLDEIDLEILKFKKIEDLLAKGLSFLEAQKIAEETLKKQREETKEKYQAIDDEEKDFENRKDIPEDDQKELKCLWRKLALKHHPDLAHGDEEVMKKINKAYAENDLETLRTIEQGHLGRNIEIATVEELKAKLINIEKSITKAKSECELLQKSEWFVLKNNIDSAHSQKRDLLNELSDKVLTDIAKKENQLHSLKEKYGEE